MVDAIGGVVMCIPHTVDDPHAPDLHLKAGTRKLDGDEARDDVRARCGIGDYSDPGRTRRQQAFIGAMISQAMSASTLANPLKVTRFLNAATKSLTTSDGFNVDDMAGLAWQLRGIGLDKVQFLTIPFEYVGPRVVWVDPATEIWDRLLHDRPLSPDLTKGAIDVGNVPNQTSTPSSRPSGEPTATGEPGGTGATPSLTPSATPSLDSNGRTAEERQELTDAGLCA